MPTSLDRSHFPRIVALGDGSRVCITRCDTEAVVFDRVIARGTSPETYRTAIPAVAVPPIAGFDPATAQAWPSDAALAAAVSAPVLVPTPPRRQLTRVILDRLAEAERIALFGSTHIGVKVLLSKAEAEGAIRDDDPDFPAAVAGLDALGIIAAARWEALLAP